MLSVCYIPKYYMQNYDYLYFVPLLLHSTRHYLLAFVLFLATVCKLSRARGADETTGVPKPIVVGANPPQQKFLCSSFLLSFLILFHFIELIFRRFLAIVCKEQLRLCLENIILKH